MCENYNGSCFLLHHCRGDRESCARFQDNEFQIATPSERSSSWTLEEISCTMKTNTETAEGNPDLVMERRIAGTWQRAVNEDTTYRMVFGTDGWVEISTFDDGELIASTKAQWKIDGSMIVLTFSGKYPNAKPFSLEDDDTLIIGGDTYQRVDPSGPS